MPPAQSPARTLLAGNTYAFCIWVRLASPTPSTAPTTSLGMYNKPLPGEAYVLLRTKAFTPSSSWQQLCLDNLHFNNAAFFTLSMGSSPAVYLIDDASLTY